VFGFLQASHSDPGAVLTFEFDPLVDPSGDVQIVPDTGEFVYIPGEAGPELTDVFRFIVSDQYGGSDTGTVTIAFSNDLRWNFIGFASPWTGSPQYSMSVDQSIDLSWFCQNPDTGAIAPSSMDTPVVWITRYPDCSFGEDIVPTGSWMTFPDEYDDGENWTLIFDGGVVGPGCYIFFIYHPYTGQSDYQTHSLEPLPLIVEVLGG